MLNKKRFTPKPLNSMLLVLFMLPTFLHTGIAQTNQEIETSPVASNQKTQSANSSLITAGTIGHIKTIAGNGTKCDSSTEVDNILATETLLCSPNKLVMDKNGNVFISGGNKIRKVDTKTGFITTIAGTGKGIFRGDGGLAINASLYFPSGIKFDKKGNLFVLDDGNNRIRRISAKKGKIITIIGNGKNGFDGDGGLASLATINYPKAITFDKDGNLFIADNDNFRIRKVDAKTRIITTVVGKGKNGIEGDKGLAKEAQLSSVNALAVDTKGNLFIADGDRIRKVDAKTNMIDTIAGDLNAKLIGDNGKATSAKLSFPQDIVLDQEDNLFIADTYNQRIRRIDAKTNIITTVAGNGKSGSTDGSTIKGTFSGDDGPATLAGISNPSGLSIDDLGNLFIADSFNNRVRIVYGIAQSKKDFTLSLTPNNLTIARGKKASVIVSVNRIGGLSGNVDITSSNKQNMPIQVNPRTVSTIGTKAKFRISVAKNAQPGTQEITFTGKDTSGLIRTVTFMLVVQ